MGLEAMNKIIVDKKDLVVENIESILELTKNVNIICKEKNKLILKVNGNINIKFILEDNCNLDILMVNYEPKNIEMEIIQNNNTVLNYIEAIISKNNTKRIINNIIEGKNNNSNIKIRCISKSEKINIEVNAKGRKNSKDNIIVEDIKGINIGGTIEIKPIMKIDTNEIVANHYVTIGAIDKNELFYLKSKGISEEKAKDLILSGFVKSIFENDANVMFGGENIE